MELKSNEYLEELRFQIIIEASEKQIEDFQKIKLKSNQLEGARENLRNVDMRMDNTYYKCKNYMNVDLNSLTQWYREKYGDRNEEVIKRAIDRLAGSKLKVSSLPAVNVYKDNAASDRTSSPDETTAQRHHYIYTTAVIRSEKTKLLVIMSEGIYYTTKKTIATIADRLTAFMKQSGSTGIKVRCCIFDFKELINEDSNSDRQLQKTDKVKIDSSLIEKTALELYGKHNLDTIKKEIANLDLNYTAIAVREFKGEEKEKRHYYYPIVFVSQNDPNLN